MAIVILSISTFLLVIVCALLQLQIRQLNRSVKIHAKLGYKHHQLISDLQAKSKEQEEWAHKSTEAITQITDILGKVVNR